MRRLRVPDYWSGIPEIVEHTYGETVVFRKGVAEVQTDAAYNYLVNMGYVPVDESFAPLKDRPEDATQIAAEGADSGVCRAK
ncbi:MAG: hypothetical protein ACK4WF_07070 [Candidatus Brocadiales bacterium]